ncbi:hypothetical protein Cri9333_0327 [Crinalium epipsammum PCC 9333]|uniref:HNH endonuclease n=1 Tax=Crinalium epipsammum PCC 9333 TaxID=1173022 RepID=K9VUS1_9CYAN|nr:hypothetical protein [Crinalium epipsammum]AFZ11309.1 hypothetical protein Cri9333_0327 [Crinalium epipsammum PCC 9333]
MAVKYTKEYKEYISSDNWRAKNRAFKRFVGGKPECFCGAIKKLHVHHLHYKNLGNEKFEDLLYVCTKHHQQIHTLQRRTRVSIVQATKRVQFRYTRNGVLLHKLIVAFFLFGFVTILIVMTEFITYLKGGNPSFS